MKSTKRIAATACAVILIAALGCGGSGESSGEAEKTDARAERQTEAVFEKYVAPDVALRGLDGDTVMLSEYRGKFTLLAFFATWNKDTAKLLPIMADIDRRFHKNVNAVCVAIDKGGPAPVRGWLDRNPVDIPIFVGDESVASEFGGYRKLPTVYVLMRDGEVFRRFDGLQEQRQYEDILIKLISHRL